MALVYLSFLQIFVADEIKLSILAGFKTYPALSRFLVNN